MFTFFRVVIFVLKLKILTAFDIPKVFLSLKRTIETKNCWKNQPSPSIFIKVIISNRASKNITCHSSDDCKNLSSHATCSKKNRCKCEHNYILTETGCDPQLYINCEHNEPCANVNSACIENFCRCKPYYKSVNGICKLKPILHERCTDHSGCSEEKFTICGANKRCICRPNYFARNGTCLAGLGEYCQRTDPCAVENSVCIDNKCQIAFLATSTDERSSKQDLLGKQCESNLDCKFIINSVCLMNKCICDGNFSAFGESACAPTLNGPCSNDDECLFGNFSCVYNKCQCIPYFTSVSVGQCVNDNSLFSCNHFSECSDIWHSTCSSHKKCVCKLNNKAVDRSCLPLLNGLCWIDDQCLVPNSGCFDNRCLCKTNFIAVADNLCLLQ